MTVSSARSDHRTGQLVWGLPFTPISHSLFPNKVSLDLQRAVLNATGGLNKSVEASLGDIPQIALPARTPGMHRESPLGNFRQAGLLPS